MIKNMQERIDILEARTNVQDDAFQNLHTVVPNVLNNLVGTNGNNNKILTKFVSKFVKKV
jgi:uncharacterized coiled-coil protein SlyX